MQVHTNAHGTHTHVHTHGTGSSITHTHTLKKEKRKKMPKTLKNVSRGDAGGKDTVGSIQVKQTAGNWEHMVSRQDCSRSAPSKRVTMLVSL